MFKIDGSSMCLWRVTGNSTLIQNMIFISCLMQVENELKMNLVYIEHCLIKCPGLIELSRQPVVAFETV